MRVRWKVSFLFAASAFFAAASGASVSACGDPNAFQPITNGAKPWTPPPGWAPQLQCTVGYFVTIDTCPGCTGISYALCTGDTFNQCVCGGPFTPGAQCPAQFHCAPNDFPPQGWQEFTDYTGPGWAGLDQDAGGGTDAGTGG